MSKDHSRSKTGVDLGKDSIGKLLLRLSLPAILAQLTNALYSIINRMYLGNLPGQSHLALSALGVCMPILILITALSSLVGMGGAPRVSARMGKGDYAGAERILGSCFTTILLISATITLVLQLFMAPILQMFGASGETLPYAMSYLRIYSLGTVFMQISLGMNFFISAQGFAKTSMITILLGAGLNIVLDPILIFGLRMGLPGAALATVISQGVAAAWVMRFLLGPKTQLKIRRENMPIRWKILAPVLLLGLSPFAMKSTEGLVSIAFNIRLRDMGGDVAVGAMTILTSILQVGMMPVSGMGQGAQPILSFNLGARKADRVKEAFRILLFSSLGWSVTYWAVLMLFPGWFAGLFSSDPALLETAVWAMRIYLAAQFISGAQIACQQTLVAVEQAKASLFLALLRKLFLLVPLMFILPSIAGLGLTGVFLAQPTADLVAFTITALVFYTRFSRVLRGLREGRVQEE